MSEPTAEQAPGADEELRRRLDEAAEALRVEQARNSEERRQSARHQNEFLTVLVHDLRNALMPIGSAIEIIEGNTSRADQQAALQILARQVRELGSLVGVLADASRVYRGGIELLKRPLVLAEVVGRAAAECRGLIEQRQHRLNVASPTEPLAVLGDAERLNQMVTGLLHNAAQFTDPGGQINLSATSQGESIVIRIEDTGIGIAPECLPGIFDLFTKAGHGDNGPRGGLGVGLTVIRKLAELHGGSVQAFSDGPGRGSAFVVCLPRLTDSVRPAGEAEQAKGAVAPPRSRRILVVSDNAEFAQEWSLLLRVAGHVVQTAATTSAALEAIAAFQPEVLSVDLRAAPSDLQRLSECVRQGSPAQRPCVIGLANGETAPGQYRLHEAHCDALLAPPFRIRDFLKIILDKEKSIASPAPTL